MSLRIQQPAFFCDVLKKTRARAPPCGKQVYYVLKATDELSPTDSRYPTHLCSPDLLKQRTRCHVDCPRHLASWLLGYLTTSYEFLSLRSENSGEI